MSQTQEKWLSERLLTFDPCGVAEFDAFALGGSGLPAEDGPYVTVVVLQLLIEWA
jgi:hypothetical protein